MGRTDIEWTDYTWNPVTGCTPCSPGCEHCYAAGIAKRFWKDRPFSEVRCHEDRLHEPLSWRRPGRVFVCSMGDLFHPDVPTEFIIRVWQKIAALDHTFLILTKRPQRLLEFTQMGTEQMARAREMGNPWMEIWPRHVWLGVTACNQAEADAKIPILLETPAARRFVSIEPMLGPVDLGKWLGLELFEGDSSVGIPGPNVIQTETPAIDWVIVGGETGPGARPMHPDWVRGVRDQCVAAGVPLFVKQWGEWSEVYPRGRNLSYMHETMIGRTVMYRVGRKAAGHLLDGREWREFPS